MKTVTVSLLLCAVMALTGATAKVNLVKRSHPVHWTVIKGRYFHYVAALLNWANAEKNCQALGGNLASVHSAAEYREIQGLIAKITNGYGRAWLGGSDCQKEGVWLWSDGTPFTYQHCGKFDNLWWKQHCLQMNYGENKCWDDVQCSRKLPSVCAKKKKTLYG